MSAHIEMSHRRSRSCDLTVRRRAAPECDSTFMREMTDLVHCVYNIRLARRESGNPSNHNCPSSLLLHFDIQYKSVDHKCEFLMAVGQTSTFQFREPHEYFPVAVVTYLYGRRPPTRYDARALLAHVDYNPWDLSSGGCPMRLSQFIACMTGPRPYMLHNESAKFNHHASRVIASRVPIIIAHFGSKAVIVDGNHRLCAAVIANSPIDVIEISFAELQKCNLAHVSWRTLVRALLDDVNEWIWRWG